MKKCTYLPKTPQRYAINTRHNKVTNCLEWDTPVGQSTLVVQCPFGERPVDKIDQICAALEQSAIEENVFTEILPNIFVRFISAADKGRLHGCPLNGASRTYMVFACDIEKEEYIIYEPQMQAMAAPYCDIPIDVKVEVLQQKKTVGWLKKEEVPTGFYIMEFIGESFGGYLDGDLQYKIADMHIPITNEMVKQRRVYIKSDIKPNVIAARKGIRLQ